MESQRSRDFDIDRIELRFLSLVLNGIERFEMLMMEESPGVVHEKSQQIYLKIWNQSFKLFLRKI